MPARTGMVATRVYVDAAIAEALSTSGSGSIPAAVAQLRTDLDTLSASAVKYNTDGTGVTVNGNLSVTGALTVGTTNVLTRIGEVATAVSSKQDPLTAGTGISISAEGLISLSRQIDSTVSSGSSGLITSGAVATYVTGMSYVLPKATVSTLGGIIVGSGLAVDANGVVTASGERNTITSVKVASGNSLTPDGDRAVTIPAATAQTYGVVKVDTAGTLSITNGTLSSSAQVNILEEVVLSGHSNPLVPSAKRVTIPLASSTGFSGLVKVRQGYSKLYFDADGYLCTTGEENTVSDVRDAFGNSLIPQGGDVATVPIASASTLGVVKVGNGLSINSGSLSVKTGSGLMIETDGSVKVNQNIIASKDSVDSKAAQSSLDETNATVSSLSTAVTNFEITAGASDQIFTCVPDPVTGEVMLHNHGINVVPVTLTCSSVTLVVPVSSSQMLSRDMYVLFSFYDTWTGSSFSISGIRSASDSETLTFCKTDVNTFSFSGISAGEKKMMYFTEIEASTFMASSKKLISHVFSA